jgi:hypothetical protein
MDRESASPAARYPMRNDTAEEGDRLKGLQALHDSSTITRLEALGVAEGWNCVEVGAGAGSIAGWLSGQVGPTGSVTAIDRDLTQLNWLEERPNVILVKGDLSSMPFGHECFDLAHSRSVLMHLDPAVTDDVVGRVAGALRQGGQVLFEEADGLPLEDPGELPAPFAKVMAPIARRWTWARHLPDLLTELGLVEVHDDVRNSPMMGATAGAAFWKHTLSMIRPMLTDDGVMRSQGLAAVDDQTFDAMLALLDDPEFNAPFANRHFVSARRAQ